VLAFQLPALGVGSGIEALGFGGPVIAHIRPGRAGAHQVIKAPLRVIGGAVPAAAGKVTSSRINGHRIKTHDQWIMHKGSFVSLWA